MLRKIVLGLALAAGAALPLANVAEAAVADGVVASHNASDQLVQVDKVQFVYGGQNYCWYDSGWKGPGWYYCGYAWRTGYGWGGPVGWRGWSNTGWHGGYYHGWHGGYYHPGYGRYWGPRYYGPAYYGPAYAYPAPGVGVWIR